MRVVPREKESINETWLSDRDRFSYLGLKSPNRAGKPKIKRNGQWETVDWSTALKFVADGLAKVIKQHGAEQVAAFASASSTLEELYLMQKWMRALGVNNLDYRLQQVDFRDQDGLTTLNNNGIPYAALEEQQAVLLVGCNIHREVPLAGVRLRKAFRNGAEIHALNPVNYDFHFKLNSHVLVSPQEMPMALAKILAAITAENDNLPVEIQRLLIGLQVDESSKAIAKALCREKAAILTGALCQNHP